MSAPELEPGRTTRRPSTASPLPLRASVLLLLAVLGVTVAVFGLVVAGVLLVPGGREHALTLLALTLPVHSAAVLAVVHVGLRRAGTGWAALGFRRPTAHLLHLLWQFPVLVVGVLVVQALVLLPLGTAPPASDDVLADVAAGSGPGMVTAVLLTVVVLVPIGEEAVFRGVVHGGLRRRRSAVVAALLSGACFAAAHGVPLLLPYMLTLGVGLAVLREVHRTLWAPVLAHAGINALASVSVVAVLLG